MRVRQKVIESCLQRVDNRTRQITDELKLVQASANQETKSSAGDKYETGRAMAQLEIERLTSQLAEAEVLRSKLVGLKDVGSTDKIVPGVLITTTQGKYFISVSLGLIEVENEKYFCLSADAPIAKALMGKGAGEEVSFQGKTFSILSID
ncbi:MAG TPA: hypothetical protein PLV21_07485 [Cyclobacteriaceae bacterium]|nr:hypothetical protein [Cyclobacteriaceae bacterium]HRJ81707.1 hypothetical protein [Cyclobacteriaceae bacterium]